MITQDKCELSGGWIDPEGRFYACKYYEHDITEEMLLEEHFYFGESLLSYGWVKLLSNGTPVITRWSFTQAQLDVLTDIVELSPTEPFQLVFKGNLKAHLDMYKEAEFNGTMGFSLLT